MNPVFYVAVQAVCFGFVFFCDAVLNNPTVENFVVNILGKNATMSGRANIYIKVPMILTGHRAWTTGFGYATSYELGRKLGDFQIHKMEYWSGSGMQESRQLLSC